MLSLTIGVAAFISVVAFGTGARSAVLDQFEALGVDRIGISRKVQPGVSRRPLQEVDVQALETDAVGLDLVVPVSFLKTFVRQEERQAYTKVNATSPDFFLLHDLQFAWGGGFDADDQLRRRKVCVLGPTPAEKLFGLQDPLGAWITVHGVMRCRVIGVLGSRGRAISGQDMDDLVLMPYSTFFTFVRSTNPRFNTIDVRPFTGLPRRTVEQQITQALRRSREVAADQPVDVRLSSPDDAIEVADEVATILTRLLAGIAAVSLIVGGIGIMNIQLVAVAERVREIGVRSAIGASPRQILGQFLIEAVLLAALGTVAGCVVGTAVAVAVADAMRWDQGVPYGALGIAMLFGLGLGVGFGYLPALRAANLDPIEALRRE